MKKFTLLGKAMILSLLPFSLYSQVLTNNLLFTARLDGDQVSPQIETEAHGVATLSINGNRDSMCLNVSLAGFTDSITSIGLYNSAVDSNGSLTIDFSSIISGNRLVTSIVGTFISPESIADLLKGHYSLRVSTSDSNTALIAGYFRLESYHSFMAVMDGEQEVPSSGSNGYGLALFRLNMDHSKMKINMMVDGLTGSITGAHLHTGSEGEIGPVAVDLTEYMSNGMIEVTIDSGLFLSIIDSLMQGNVYLNVHTSIYPNGEIRGQLKPDKGIAFHSYLNGEQQVPPVNTDALGLAHVGFNANMDSATYHVIAVDMSDSLTGAHLHLGKTGVAGPVVVDLATSENLHHFLLSGTIDSLSYTDSLLRDLMVGNIYVNLHTDEHPDGEIRGQMRRYIWEGFTFSLDGSQEVPAVTTAAKGSGFAAINPEANDLHFMLAADYLSDTATAAHFHEGSFGEEGPAFFTLTDFLTQQSSSTTGQGSLFGEGFWNDQNNPPLTSEIVALFGEQKVYINIHTELAPNGEIRGQVIQGTECFKLTTGIQEAIYESTGSVSLYPNPANNYVTISILTEFSGENTVLNLYDLHGRMLWSDEFGLPAGIFNKELDLTLYSPGIYFIEIRNGQHSLVQKLEKI